MVTPKSTCLSMLISLSCVDQELRTMLHEARDRQKFVSDVQYLRDMQHKVDSEYQVMAGAGLPFPFSWKAAWVHHHPPTHHSLVDFVFLAAKTLPTAIPTS